VKETKNHTLEKAYRGWQVYSFIASTMRHANLWISVTKSSQAGKQGPPIYTLPKTSPTSQHMGRRGI